MTESELATLFSERFEGGCAIEWGRLILEQELFVPAMNLALLSSKGTVPFRAAYALECAFLQDPERFMPYCERLAADYTVVTHPSVWRHYGKIMGLLLKKKRLLLTDEQAGKIAETAVMRLVDGQVPVGARVWSLDVLYHLRGRVTWIDEELPAIIDDLKIDPQPAMVCRLRRFGWMKR